MSRRMNDRLPGNRGFGFRAIVFLRRGFIRVPRSRGLRRGTDGASLIAIRV